MRRALVTLVLAGVCLLPLSAAQRRISVDEIKPGMVGVGRTVFGGTTVQEFKVHILGVLRNVIGPSRNLVLARLEGGPLAETGVIAGMSGSPVYVDGRLLGAVSYSLGAFSKEPIAGITPIEEMVDAARLPVRRPDTRRVRLELPITPAMLADTLRRSVGLGKPFADSAADVAVVNGSSTVLSPQLGPVLRPITTPLVMGGFGGDVADLLSAAFRESGFQPVVGVAGGTVDPTPSTEPLHPGDAVGVALVSGDLALGGTGTVTHVEDGRVYAFGHPFYNLGPTIFPMTRAYVHTLLPSLMSSSKLASLGEVIGTFEQDRATTIAGTLGPGPSMLPLTIALEPSAGPRRTFRIDVVRDQLFTPLLTYVSILNTLKSYEREFGASSFTVKGKASVGKHGEIAFEDLFTGDSPSIGAAMYVAGPLTFLLKNDLEPVEIDALTLTIASTEEPRTATIERVWLDGADVKAGRTVRLKMLVRTYRGEEVTRTVPIEIPGNASGQLTVMVADGNRLTQWEQREVRQSQPVQDVAQIVRAFNRARKNNRLYIRLLAPDPGAVVSGESLSALPPSILAVLEGDRSGGSFVPLRNATLGEWELPLDYAVSGSRFLTLTLSSD
jgi:SpoIVB peptidase S55